jgi:hypothetical protein
VHQRVTRGGGGGKEANLTLSCNRVMSGEAGNLVVKVDVKENIEEGLKMANTELLEAWVRQIWSPVRQISLPGCPRCV